MMQTLRQFIVYFLMVSLTSTSFMYSAHAGMIPTEQIAAAAEAQARRSQVAAALSRPEVLSRLEEMGVSPAEAQARVNALTDAEVAELADKIDGLPAGGDSIIGALVLIFLVLLVTDIIGLTKVFPFTRSAR